MTELKEQMGRKIVKHDRITWKKHLCLFHVLIQERSQYPHCSSLQWTKSLLRHRRKNSSAQVVFNSSGKYRFGLYWRFQIAIKLSNQSVEYHLY